LKEFLYSDFDFWELVTTKAFLTSITDNSDVDCFREVLN
jgi:hypothetical protein